MTIEAISQRLVQLLKNKAFIEAQEELFDDQVLSQEPYFHPQPQTKGLTQLIEKEQQFLASIASWLSYEVSAPIIAKDHFSLRLYARLKLHTGQTIEIDEIIVYQVAGNKIISETFFYQPSTT